MKVRVQNKFAKGIRKLRLAKARLSRIKTEAEPIEVKLPDGQIVSVEGCDAFTDITTGKTYLKNCSPKVSNPTQKVEIPDNVFVTSKKESSISDSSNNNTT